MRFEPKGHPESESELSEIARQQIRAAGRVYDGLDTPVAERLKACGEGALEAWQIVDQTGAVRYQLWILGGDAGTMFFAETTRVVGHIVQFGFTGDAHPEAWAEIAAASDPPEMIDFSNEPV